LALYRTVRGFAQDENSMSIKVDKLIRSKRRSISLEITRDAQLVVRMPKYGSLRDVERFVREKSAWIEQKMAEISERIAKRPVKKFVEGEEFYYLGEKYKLLIVENQNPKLKFQNGFYLEAGNSSMAKNIFIKWYKRQAKLNIPKRVQWYATQNNLKYGKIKITSASRRWGSCSAEGNLNFTWKLMLMPISILDYVVVHELAHTVHHDHSKRFWAVVGKIIPDYREKRRWLKKNGEEFSL